MSSTRYVDVKTALTNLEDSDLARENVDAITEFIDHCAAEGLSEVRQRRLISALKSVVLNFAPEGFQLQGASESELKQVIASLNRSEYTESTKHTMRSAVKKFYKVENGGQEHPDKVDFFTVSNRTAPTTVGREDLFTEVEFVHSHPAG